MTEWTPLMVERLVQLVDSGAPYLEIAEILSREFNVALTKNACIGKGRRLQVPTRLPKRTPAWPADEKRKPSELQSSAQRKRWLEQRRKRARRRVLESRPAQASQDPPPQPNMRNLSLLQLRPTNCRWPSGISPLDLTFCGAPRVDRLPYCQKHSAVAFPFLGKRR